MTKIVDWALIPTVTERKQTALQIVDAVISGLVMLLFFILGAGILYLIHG